MNQEYKVFDLIEDHALDMSDRRRFLIGTDAIYGSPLLTYSDGSYADEMPERGVNLGHAIKAYQRLWASYCAAQKSFDLARATALEMQGEKLMWKTRAEANSRGIDLNLVAELTEQVQRLQENLDAKKDPTLSVELDRFVGMEPAQFATYAQNQAHLCIALTQAGGDAEVLMPEFDLLLRTLALNNITLTAKYQKPNT